MSWYLPFNGGEVFLNVVARVLAIKYDMLSLTQPLQYIQPGVHKGEYRTLIYTHNIKSCYDVNTHKHLLLLVIM